jgi:hypothetical protein
MAISQAVNLSAQECDVTGAENPAVRLAVASATHP